MTVSLSADVSVSESDAERESIKAEDEFSSVQVEDTNSYMEQLDSEVSHLVQLSLTLTHMHDSVPCARVVSVSCEITFHRVSNLRTT